MDDEKIDVKVKFGTLEVGAETGRRDFTVDREAIEEGREYCGHTHRHAVSQGGGTATDAGSGCRRR